MNEDEWLEEVDEILKENGVSLDTSSDGWYFLFENGYSPNMAIDEMLNGC